MYTLYIKGDHCVAALPMWLERKLFLFLCLCASSSPLSSSFVLRPYTGNNILYWKKKKIERKKRQQTETRIPNLEQVHWTKCDIIGFSAFSFSFCTCYASSTSSTTITTYIAKSHVLYTPKKKRRKEEKFECCSMVMYSSYNKEQKENINTENEWKKEKE